MSDDELVKHMTGLITAGLDRVEQLTADKRFILEERNRLQKMLEWEDRPGPRRDAILKDLDRVAALTKGHDLQWPYVSEVALKASATLKELEAQRDSLVNTLWEILACETPNANATVTRMATIARDELRKAT